jgi:hypothetical protein
MCLKQFVVAIMCGVTAAGCTSLDTGNRKIDHEFSKVQTATEKPADCFLVSGCVAVLVWLGLKSPGGLPVGEVGGVAVSVDASGAQATAQH